MALPLLAWSDVTPSDRAADKPAHPADVDAPLVERFRAGDSRAFEELVRRYRRSIWHLALRYLRDEHEAEDVAQRAFVRAFEKLSLFRGDASFRTWLYRITVNLSLNHLRDHAREKPQPIDDDALTVEPAEASGASASEARHRGARLRAAITELPPKQRLVVELRIFDELPFREVAAIAECSEDSAKANFHHALKRLQKTLQEEP